MPKRFQWGNKNTLNGLKLLQRWFGSPLTVWVPWHARDAANSSFSTYWRLSSSSDNSPPTLLGSDFRLLLDKVNTRNNFNLPISSKQVRKYNQFRTAHQYQVTQLAYECSLPWQHTHQVAPIGGCFSSPAPSAVSCDTCCPANSQRCSREQLHYCNHYTDAQTLLYTHVQHSTWRRQTTREQTVCTLQILPIQAE